MRRTRRIGTLILVLLALLSGAIIWYTSSIMRQAPLDRQLIAAIKTYDAGGVKQALQRGADPNAREYGTTVSPWQRILNLLLRRPTHDKPTPALLIALEKKVFDRKSNVYRTADPEIMRMLIRRGADVNLIDRAGTPLMMDAMLLYDPPVAEEILQHGADPNTANAEGDTALMWATQHGSIELVTSLLAHGARANAHNNRGQTPLMWVMGPLFNVGSMPARSNPSDVIATLLLAHGADINATDQVGDTALMLASSYHQASVPLLLAHGANVNARYGKGPSVFSLRYSGGGGSVSWNGFTNGSTLLIESARMGDRDMMRLLLAHGADINATDVNGKTALQWARDSQTRALLKQAGAKN